MISTMKALMGVPLLAAFAVGWQAEERSSETLVSADMGAKNFEFTRFHHDIDDTTITMSHGHACVITHDQDTGRSGVVRCWGDEDPDRRILEAPEDLFIQIAASHDFTCGVTVEERIRCWGRGAEYPYRLDDQPPAGMTYQQVTAGASHICAIDSHHKVKCFGRNHSGQSDGPADPDADFVQVSCGGDDCCAIDARGYVHCWGESKKLRRVPTETTFVQVSLSESGSACAIAQDDGHMECWGRYATGNGTPTQYPGSFVQVSVGSAAVCAIKMDGTLACFGTTLRFTHPQFGAPPPETMFLEITSHDSTMCGVTAMLEMLCWGDRADIRAVPPGVTPMV